MLNFAQLLDRVRPQASLAIALFFSVAWIAALWQILLQKSAIVMTRWQPGFWERRVILLLLEAGYSGISLTGWTADMHWARWTCIDHRWRTGDQLYEPAKILRDRCQHELKLRTAWPA
jgi:hypothetical protein